MVVQGEDSDLGVKGAVAVDPVLAKGLSTAGGPHQGAGRRGARAPLHGPEKNSGSHGGSLTERRKSILDEEKRDWVGTGRKYVWHAMSGYDPEASTMVVTEGEGAWISDTDGNRYLDGACPGCGALTSATAAKS
jgi:hypothetical protein